MQSGTHNKAGTTTLCTVALLLTTAIPSYSGAITDSFQSIAEQAWMEQYIPRSDEETQPLTNYDNFEVTELFRAETIEDLEASLTDGYPMPWLEEILKDTTIPWEDRYWLDCRVRAAMVRDLHLFYDKNGSTVSIEYDYLHPGEDYWRENFIINPPGESYWYDSPDLPTRIADQPGYIMNLYGEKVGDIAMTRCRVWLSRDASAAITTTGIEPGGYRADNACFLYPDGSFIEREIDGIFVQFALSESGNVAVFYSADEHTPDSHEWMLYAFDSSGDLIFQRLMPSSPTSGPAKPAISPDDSYIAVSLYGAEVWLLDAHTGEVLQTWGGGGQENRENWVWGSQLYFTPDSRYLCTDGGNILDCETGQDIFQLPETPSQIHTTETTYSTGRNTFNASSGANLVSNLYWTCLRSNRGRAPNVDTYTVEIRNHSGELLYSEPCNWRPYLSPNGVFLLGENYDSGFFGGERYLPPSTPFSVMRIGEVR